LKANLKNVSIDNARLVMEFYLCKLYVLQVKQFAVLFKVAWLGFKQNAFWGGFLCKNIIHWLLKLKGCNFFKHISSS